MPSLPPDPGKQQSINSTLSDTSTMPTPMATVYVQRNGVPTVILVPATGIIRQPQPSSSENDSAADTTECPADTPLTARQLRSKRAADTFLARHDRHSTKRAADRKRHAHPRPTRPGTTGPSPGVTQRTPRPPLSQMTTGPSAPDCPMFHTPPIAQARHHQSRIVQIRYALRLL
ncbi:hypothetical protein H257_11228 [Aphanomyces astaci]|uniref:Uncharacterized protein n=1 Tax=Aphanomyces astaci TaxID=112090 RepID=W4G5I2_APHAT|nr:hypothetical protein H257_11228 [Aphanomyces astaci]ETV74304.1 hypothetical protein H257_11228 [Aphanomyces astaci]|eukprot:XP_009836410.1 hypothetical protein H257_11228 [Aphanomyces astaci]